MPVGVAGRTLTEWCGDRLLANGVLDDMEAVEDVELALECVCWWRGMVRIELKEDDVDLRPRRPPEGRRMVERGVRGAGEIEWRFLYDEAEAEEGMRRVAREWLDRCPVEDGVWWWLAPWAPVAPFLAAWPFARA